MEQLEVLKRSERYAGQNRNIPQEWKAKAQRLCWEYNQSAPDQTGRRQEILRQLLGTCHPLTFIEPSFHCDYGFNIHTHGLAVINYNCVILDTSPVHIGARCFHCSGSVPGLFRPFSGSGPAVGGDQYLRAHHAGG